MINFLTELIYGVAMQLYRMEREGMGLERVMLPSPGTGGKQNGVLQFE